MCIIQQQQNKTKPEFPIKKENPQARSQVQERKSRKRVLGTRDLGFLLLRGYNRSLEGYIVYRETKSREILQWVLKSVAGAGPRLQREGQGM